MTTQQMVTQQLKVVCLQSVQDVLEGRGRILDFTGDRDADCRVTNTPKPHVCVCVCVCVQV